MNSDRQSSTLRQIFHAFSLVLLLTWTGASFAQAIDPAIAKAEALMKEGKATEAYALLVPLEDKYAGDPRFDYLLGIAALDSGKPDKATLAFERVLAVNPNFAGARLDMARAYYHLGDVTRAKAEFETVLGQNPPEAARVTIIRYFDLIAQHERAKRTVIRGYAEATLGRDDNVNNSGTQNQVFASGLVASGFLPPGVPLILDATNVKRGDYYKMIGLGGEIAHEIRPGIALFGGVDARYRSNNTQDRFEYKSIDGRGGATFAQDKNIFRASVGGGRFYIDQQSQRDSTTYSADWRHVFSPANQLNMFAQFSKFRFATEFFAANNTLQDLSSNNFDQSLLGAGWLHVFADGRSALTATAYGGNERDINDRADGGKRYTGGRLGVQWSIGDRIELFGALGAQHGSYDKENVAFLITRSDTQTDRALGLNWRPADRWTVRPQFVYIRNQSNISIYVYERTDISVTVRHDF